MRGTGPHGPYQSPRLVQIPHSGDFAQYVQTCLEGGDGLLRVQRGRGGDDDGIDTGAEQFSKIRTAPGDAEALGNAVTHPFVGIGDGNQFRRRMCCQHADKASTPAQAGYTDAHLQPAAACSDDLLRVVCSS